MGNPSFGGVFRLLACLGLLLLSTRVVPAFAVSTTNTKARAHSGATFPCNKPQATRLRVVLAPRADYGLLVARTQLLLLGTVRDAYGLAVADMESFYDHGIEQTWPWQPIAYAGFHYDLIEPGYVKHQYVPVDGGRPRPAPSTKRTELLRRYASGQFT